MNRFYDYQTQETKADELEEIERSISVAYFALFDLTNHLKQVRAEQLYFKTHPNFDQYLEERWGLDSKTFAIKCQVLSVVDDLLNAGIGVECCSSLPLIMEYYNLNHDERLKLARKVMSDGNGKIDQKLTHCCKMELYPKKCCDAELL